MRFIPPRTWHPERAYVKLPWKTRVLQLTERGGVLLDDIFFKSYIEVAAQSTIGRTTRTYVLTKYSIHMISLLEAGVFGPKHDADPKVGDPTRIINERRCKCLRDHYEVLTALLCEKSPETSETIPR